MSTVEIRLQLLKDIGSGLSKAETVKHLNDKFGISTSAAYWHFKNKHKWLKDYADYSNANELLFRVLTQLENINREASFQYLQTSDANAKIGFMRVRLEAISKIAEYGILPELAQEVEELKKLVNKAR